MLHPKDDLDTTPALTRFIWEIDLCITTTFVTLIAPKLDTTNLAYYMVAWLVQCKLGPAQSELDSSEENG